MLRQRIFACALALVVPSVASFALTEDFSSDPFVNWSFGIGGADPGTNRFDWNAGAAPTYVGDPTGELNLHLNSSLPTVRLDRPLGVTVTDTDSFSLTTRFSYSLTSAPGDQFMQISFGLVNSTLTGGDRTGSLLNFGSDNVFHTLEFNYFPNVSTFFVTGPTLTPTVFGAQKGSGDAFANFATSFYGDSDLGDNTVGITELPQNQTLEAGLAYNGATKVLTLSLSRVEADGSTTLLVTEVPPVDLVAAGYDTNFPFVVNSLAIMAYQDGFTSSGDPSLVADLTFQKFDFAVVPEPTTSLLVLGSLGLLICGRRFRQKLS
ncbi:MAG: hypothetical protein PCFJNLEI_00206 [Verrucomicrobiae bacterium]|nr:hypothetical protein [Verrucomicrobiae bacterium]